MRVCVLFSIPEDLGLDECCVRIALKIKGVFQLWPLNQIDGSFPFRATPTDIFDATLQNIIERVKNR
jgi:hypothetical protein